MLWLFVFLRIKFFIIHISFITMSFKCPQCYATFTTKQRLQYHQNSYHSDIDKITRHHKCTFCFKSFSRIHNLIRHQQQAHNISQIIKRAAQTPSHPAQSQPTPRKHPRILTQPTRSAFNNAILKYEWHAPTNIIDPMIFLQNQQDLVINAITPPRKWYLTLEIEFINEERKITASFRNKMETSPISENLPSQYSQASSQVLKNIEKFQGCGSGWTINKLIKLNLHTAKYLPSLLTL